jgi:hypothetical protein
MKSCTGILWLSPIQEKSKGKHMKAIETFFDGYKFRSRLEARWACFFKTLGVKYEYEKEGFDLDGVWYLPDFWLPDLQCWIEIKGQEPTDKELDMLGDLANATQKDAHLFFGDVQIPPAIDSLGWSITISPFEYNGNKTFSRTWDWHPMWTICPHCDAIGITNMGRTSRLPCGCSQTHDYTENIEYNACASRLISAYTAARQARFEHGEKG